MQHKFEIRGFVELIEMVDTNSKDLFIGEVFIIYLVAMQSFTDTSNTKCTSSPFFYFG